MEIREANHICHKLKNEILSARGKFVFLAQLLATAETLGSDMPAFLQSPAGQAAFYQAITRLVAENLLLPVGGKPTTSTGLYERYRIQRQTDAKDTALAAEIIRSIASPAALDHYLKNLPDFHEDRAIIAVISAFLRRGWTDVVTVNERAYELFGDEKFFKGAGTTRSRGETVLRRLGLTFADLGCKQTLEPFFSFQKKDFHLRPTRFVYIIENKDTFWSFKEQVMDSLAAIDADMVIYGEGKKIISSFRFIEEYDRNPREITFYYFGDLDAEGINIYCELADEYPNYRIVPFAAGYQAILEIGLSKGLRKTPKQQRIKRDNIKKFAASFHQDLSNQLLRCLEEGCYIPQEALSASEMKARFCIRT